MDSENVFTKMTLHAIMKKMLHAKTQKTQVILGKLDLLLFRWFPSAFQGTQPFKSTTVERIQNLNFPAKASDRILPHLSRRNFCKQSQLFDADQEVNMSDTLEVPENEVRPRARSPQRYYNNKSALWKKMRKLFAPSDDIEERYQYARKKASTRWDEHTGEQMDAAEDLLRLYGAQIGGESLLLDTQNAKWKAKSELTEEDLAPPPSPT